MQTQSLNSLEPVILRFPELRDKIERQFKGDPVFREVCQDYAEIQKSLDSLGDSRTSTSDLWAAEHRILLQELETEILRTLNREDRIIPIGGEK